MLEKWLSYKSFCLLLNSRKKKPPSGTSSFVLTAYTFQTGPVMVAVIKPSPSPARLNHLGPHFPPPPRQARPGISTSLLFWLQSPTPWASGVCTKVWGLPPLLAPRRCSRFPGRTCQEGKPGNLLKIFCGGCRHPWKTGYFSPQRLLSWKENRLSTLTTLCRNTLSNSPRPNCQGAAYSRCP